MGYIVVMARIPVWLVGAAVGGWLAADAYMRVAWWLQSRTLTVDGG